MEPAKPTPRALLLLLLATGLWGVGFVAVSNTLQVMHPLWSNAWRFVLAAPLALLLFRTRLVWDRAHQGAAAVAGACLALAFLFQTWGLQSTTVAKSSLITGLYCVVTPMMAPLFRAPLPTLTHGVGAVLAVVGLGVLSQVWDGGGTFNGGDALTLGCAVVSAVHIHVVAKVAPGRDALALNALQLMWTAVVSLVLAVVVAPAEYLVPPAGALGALLYLAVFCSVVAFGAQMRAQQEVSPTTASTVLLLEAPFGVLSGVVLLAEPLGGWQLLGGAMMVGGSLLSVRADTLRTRMP